MRFRTANGKLGRWHLDFESADLSVADRQAVANAAEAQWGAVAATRSLFSTDLQLGNVEIFEYSRQDNCPASPPGVFSCPDGSVRFVRKPETPIIFSAGGGNFGTAITASLPPQNALVCSLRTASAGRRFFGRAFLPPPPEGESDGTGIVSVAYSTALQDRVIAIAEAAEGAVTLEDIDHIVHSLRFGQSAQVVSYLVFRGIDTQRRRRVRPTT